MTDNTHSEQTIDVPLLVESRVQLVEEATVEKEDGEIVGGTTDIMFEDYVEQYVPETGKIAFRDSDIGREEFLDMLDEAAGIAFVYDEDVSNY